MTALTRLWSAAGRPGECLFDLTDTRIEAHARGLGKKLGGR